MGLSENRVPRVPPNPEVNHDFPHSITLWQFNVAIGNGHRNSWFTYSKWWFSIVMLVELWKITMLLMGKSTINGHFQVRKLLVYQAGYHFKDAHIGVHMSQSHEFLPLIHPLVVKRGWQIPHEVLDSIYRLDYRLYIDYEKNITFRITLYYICRWYRLCLPFSTFIEYQGSLL